MSDLKNILIESMGLKTGYYDKSGQPISLQDGQQFYLRTSELVNRFNKGAFKPITKNFVHHLIENGWLKPNGFIIDRNGKSINTYNLAALFKLLLWYKQNGEAVFKNGKHMLKPTADSYFDKWSGNQKPKPSKKEVDTEKHRQHIQQRSWYDTSEREDY